MTKKLSPKSRELLVATINQSILDCPLPEMRELRGVIFTDLLMKTNDYRGFAYIEWLEKGHDKWVKDGKPDNTIPYLGDQTLIKFN